MADLELLIGDLPFGFLESGDDLPETSFSSGEHLDDDDRDQLQENKAFWDKQLQILQATLCRSNSMESKLRKATKEILKETKESQCCCCSKAMRSDCRDCLRREVCNRLISLGFDCRVRNSKWKSSHSIPSGEHSYLEVLDKTRIIIEINFRAEFEMARASEDYKRMMRALPEVYVGKWERLRELIKIMCEAGKRCMKEKKMHMGPWRKHKYVQAKWLPPAATATTSDPLPSATRFKASMLTFDLSEPVRPAALVA